MIEVFYVKNAFTFNNNRAENQIAFEIWRLGDFSYYYQYLSSIYPGHPIQSYLHKTYSKKGSVIAKQNSFIHIRSKKSQPGMIRTHIPDERINRIKMNTYISQGKHGRVFTQHKKFIHLRHIWTNKLVIHLTGRWTSHNVCFSVACEPARIFSI